MTIIPFYKKYLNCHYTNMNTRNL